MTKCSLDAPGLGANTATPAAIKTAAERILAELVMARFLWGRFLGRNFREELQLRHYVFASAPSIVLEAVPGPGAENAGAVDDGKASNIGLEHAHERIVGTLVR